MSNTASTLKPASTKTPPLTFPRTRKGPPNSAETIWTHAPGLWLSLSQFIRENAPRLAIFEMDNHVVYEDSEFQGWPHNVGGGRDTLAASGTEMVPAS